MKIGLIDVDSHKFPNLALMKISAWHKAKQDSVEWWNGFRFYDIVYQSKVFDNNYSPDIPEPYNCDKLIKGGTGYNLTDKLPKEIERCCPGYSLYPKLTKNVAYGFLTRGCPRNCKFCIVSKKEGKKSIQVGELSDFYQGQREIKLLDPNLLACKTHENLLQDLSKSGAWVDFTQGLDIRLINKDNISLINQMKIKMIHFAWDNPKEDILDYFQKFNWLTTVKEERKKRVYVLTNFNSTHEEDLDRVYTLRKLKFDPYIMIYNKWEAPRETRLLQRWCNNKLIYRAQPDFAKYDPRMG